MRAGATHASCIKNAACKISAKHVLTDQQIEDIFDERSFTREEWNEVKNMFGMVPKYFGRTPSSALLPLAQQMAKRSHPFTDEASKFTGAKAKEFSRWLQCDIKRAHR